MKRETFNKLLIYFGIFCEFVFRFLILWIIINAVLLPKFGATDDECQTIQACIWNGKEFLFLIFIGLFWAMNGAFLAWDWSLTKEDKNNKKETKQEVKQNGK